MKTTIKLLIGVAVLSIPGAAAYAQESPASDSDGTKLPEIVITATKTGETNLQKTPLAISALSGAQVERGIVSDVRDLSKLTPGLNISQNSDNAEIYIRGIGSSNVYNGSDPSATLQIDGVYISRPYAQFADFLDVARVEVLRGPQGTLYGRNAIAGTINIVSRQPSDRFAADTQVVAGNYNTLNGQAYISGPLVKGALQASVSVNYLHHDPYIENINPNGTGVNSANRGGVRIQLRAEPAAGLDMTTRIDYSLDRSRPNGIVKLTTPIDTETASIDGDYHKIANDTPDRGRVRSTGVAEDMSYALGDGLKLRSITAYRNNTNFVDTDADASGQHKQELFLDEDEHQFSQEFSVNGKLGFVTGVAGIYYFHEVIDTKLYVSVFGANTKRLFQPYSNTDSYAAFTQLTFQLPANLSFVAGLRYTDETKRFLQTDGTSSLTTGQINGSLSSYDLTGKYHSVTPKFGLNWTPASNVLVYASATKGFKSGGFNATSTSAATAAFGPENLWSYEIGEKADFLNKTLRVNLTAFKYNYADLQVQETIGPGLVSITNAANARLWGVEAEVIWLPARWVEFGANVAGLHAEYSSYPDAAFTGGGTGDATGNWLNNAPKFSASEYVQFTRDTPGGSEISLRASHNYKSRIYYDASNRSDLSQPAFSLFDADLEWRSPNRSWTAGIFVKNIANKQYLTFLSSQAGGILQAVPGDPRTFGIRLGRHW